jgi:hypothetical protein
MVMALGNVEIPAALEKEGVSDDRIDQMLSPHRRLIGAARRAAQARNRRVLENFERKYGPGSPQLNAVEVALNYGAQFVPFLGTSALSGPNPLEIVASYNTLTVKVAGEDADKPAFVSAGRLGLRYYFFGGDWGSGRGVARYLKPSHMSLGLLTMGPQDDALRRVWGHGYRAGPFLGWGDLFAGYVTGSRYRVVVGTQKYLIPRVL